MNLSPISEKQIRDWQKNGHFHGAPAGFLFRYSLRLSKDQIVSADKMMNRAKGPVWHKKHKDQGIIPKGLQQKKIHRERAYKVEPMQGLVKDIFELDRCWVRSDDNNR
jgi:hypothetical protein